MMDGSDFNIISLYNERRDDTRKRLSPEIHVLWNLIPKHIFHAIRGGLVVVDEITIWM